MKVQNIPHKYVARLKPRTALLLYTLPLLAFAWLTFAAVIETRNVAVTHDELWDYYPAVGMINAKSLAPRQEISILGFPFPLVTGPYQGAFKTWGAAPVLKVLGTSVYVLRGLNVFLSMLYLFSLWWALSAAVPRHFSLMVFLVPMLDPNFLVYAPMDYGPFLMQAIATAMAVGCLGRYITTSDRAYVFLSFLAAGMILAQKLTALPILISYLAALTVFAYPTLVYFNRKQILLMMILFTVPLIPHLVYFGKSGVTDLITMTRPDRNLPYFAKLKADFLFFMKSFDGVDWVNRLTGKELHPRPPAATGYAGVIVVVIGSINNLFVKDRTISERRIGWMYLFLLIAGFISFAFFKGLDRPWHYHLLRPLFMLAVFHSIFLLYRYGIQKYSTVLVYGTACLLLLGVLVPAVANGWKLLELQEQEKGFVLTSLGLYHLERELESRGARKVFCLNYSLCNPLYVLSGGRLTVVDMTWAKFSDALLSRTFEDTYHGKDTFIVYRHSYYKEWDQDWIRWLNRGSTYMFARMPTLVLPAPAKDLQYPDGRATVFGLLFF